jgi:membrane-bound acyltransferase YfiQ involved in biofilm formation
MYNTFILTLENNADTYDITFDIFSTNIAQRWAFEVAKNYPFFETTRFQGWPNIDKLTSYTRIRKTCIK